MDPVSAMPHTRKPQPIALMALLLTLSMVAPATAETPNQELVYRLAFGEVSLGEARIRLQNSGAVYRVAMNSKSLGPLDKILTWTSQAESSGRTVAGQFQPDVHDRHSSWRGEKRSIHLRYLGGRQVAVEAQPPEDPAKTRRILAKLTQAPIDPYSAALRLLHQFDANGHCGDKLTVFDGRRLYAVEMRDDGAGRLQRDRPWGYSGDVHRCTLITQRIDHERDADDGDGDDDRRRHEINVWLGKVSPTAWAPVRVEVPLPIGRLIARLAPNIS